MPAAAPEWHGTKTGWLFNYHVTTVLPGGGKEGGGGKEQPAADQDPAGADDKASTGESALQLFFIDLDGETFECPLKYQPYFFVAATEGHEREVELGLTGAFGTQVVNVAMVEKEDLGMVNHLSGKKRKFIKLTFANTNELTAVRSAVEKALTRNKQQSGAANNAGGGFGSADLDFRESVSAVPIDARAPGALSSHFDDDVIDAATGEAMAGGNQAGGASSKMSWMRYIEDIREYDVKYFTRVAIDLEVFVGLWYDVESDQGQISVTQCDASKYTPAVPTICAFDIETTKAPLKFPQVETDQIYMISYMIDHKGFLLVNREIVTEDIEPFEYTPRPEFEGHFEVFNEADEAAVLRRWYDEMKRHKPLVYVTYNGDYFDFPFIQARSEFHGMSLRNELGFSMSSEGATLHPRLPHLDCFYWVKRDSYLPQGSQGLKAVTKAKLGYEPIEVDPEDMLPLAREQPQMMASYSVSDAVSTYYLYMKYVHPFIYSLCTIIPMAPDDVLRKGSGTLCESLLCVQAYKKEVIWPNKQVTINERFFDGHLLDAETYIGGRVEALESGVYRSDVPIKFKMVPDAFQKLADDLDAQLKFTIEEENGTKLEDVANYDEVRDDIRNKLLSLRDTPDRFETPMIYHLDVGAMYPNIILTNRLQPPSMVTEETCAGCCYNTPENDNKCKRPMQWKWKGDMFTAGRHEFQRIKAQLESEAFAAGAVEKADAAATTKKTYGNKRGNVLEGTSFERKTGGEDWKKGKGGAGAGSGYRKQSAQQEREAREALLASGSDGDSDGEGAGDGTTRFHKLKENTQFSLLKKRMGEYSRKAYRKATESKEILKTATVCQRENSFYVDTVRLFRDRRYHYKRELKRWKGLLDKATEPAAIKEAKAKVVQMESLQLAHKCILNSFYGYVMRKGSRWYSMEMAGVVTYLGASLIMMARQLVQQIGITLELDTDGIWCCLPVSFPEDFVFKTKAGKSFTISYPCVVLNKDVQDQNSNHQYQDLAESGEVGSYKVRSECSIYFEVDGPYKAMILPASREQGKGIKKRYAVFHPDGKLAELKGFELKRRGELMLIKDFQSQVFRRFLDGGSLAEAYASAAQPANDALDLLYSQGEGYDDEEILAKLLESSNMTRRLAEYPESQKSLALTTARRIADFLGPQMVKDKGLACHFIIAAKPHGKPVTERPIPLNIFKAEPAVRAHYLRHWTGDMSITTETSVKELLDWSYYIGRFNACVQKIISIPAALQHCANPVPRVEHPDWLRRVVLARSQKHKQVTLAEISARWKAKQVHDVEDVAKQAGSTAAPKPASHARLQEKRRQKQLAAAAAAANGDGDEAMTADGHSAAAARFVDAFLEELSDADDVDVGEVDVDDEAPVDCDDNESDVVMPEEAAAEQRDLRDIERAKEEEALAAVAQEKRDVDNFADHHMRRDAGPITEGAFEHRGFKPWLRESKAKWIERVRLRKRLFVGENTNANVSGTAAQQQQQQSAASGGLTTQFVERKAKAMSGPWHVLEVRDAPDANCPAGVDVYALVNGAPLVARVQVKRTVLIETATDDCISTIFGNEAHLVKPVTGMKTLPRHRTSSRHLFEVDVSSMRDGGAGVIDRLKHREEAVLSLHEDYLKPSDCFVHHAGAVCTVDSGVHLARVAANSAAVAAGRQAGYTLPREVFASNEVAPLTTTAYLGNAVTPVTTINGDGTTSTSQGSLRHVFVFHAAVPDADSRSFTAAFFPNTGVVVAAVCQPAGAARPALNIKSYVRDAAQMLQVDPATIPATDVNVQFVTEARAAFTVIDQAIDDSLNGPANSRVQVAVVQSHLPTATLCRSNAIPSLAAIAALRTVGSAEDNAIITSNPLTWARDIARRSAQRYGASGLWLDERRTVAAVSSVPLCSLKNDVFLSAWDVMYARALRRRGHVLWNGATDSAVDEEEEVKATQTSCPGGHVTWSVELGIGQLDIVATLFSQAVQEGDDPSMLALTDKGIGTHFAIMRDLVSAMYSRTLNRDEAAGAVLVNFARWLRCPASATYDPVIVTHVNTLVARVLAALLIRITKLGGRIVRADRRSVVIGSSKTTLHECTQFGAYVLSNLTDNPVLRHLAPSVTRYWANLIIVDREDFIGLAVDPERLQEIALQKLQQREEVTDVDAEAAVGDSEMPQQPSRPKDPIASLTDADIAPALEVKAQLELIHDYTAALGNRFLQHVASALQSIEAAKQATEAALAADPTVTLATRFDRYLDFLLAEVERRLDREFQPTLIRDVSDMVENDMGTIEQHGEEALAVRPSPNINNAATSEVQRKIDQLAPNVRVALRFFKDVCHVLGMVPRCEAVVRKSRNNCLRICDIGAFAPEAAWEKHSRGEARLVAACHFCNDQCEIDLTRPIPDWRCNRCGSVLSADGVEAALVRRCRRHYLADLTDDRVCPKCRQVAATAVVTVCNCGSPLKSKKDPRVGALRQIQTIAVQHDLVWLREVAEYTLEAMGDHRHNNNNAKKKE